MNHQKFERVALYCQRIYGSPIFFNEINGEIEAFICPECDELLCYEDIEDGFEECWVCGFDFYEGE